MYFVISLTNYVLSVLSFFRLQLMQEEIEEARMKLENDEDDDDALNVYRIKF